MRNTHFRTGNMARKTEKGGKFRNIHCRTWNMARKLKIMENETLPILYTDTHTQLDLFRMRGL